MTGPDPFEDRLRETLRSGDSTGARPDVDAFLSDIHRGARSRQRRRLAGAAAAAVLAVVGGGVAIGSIGAFQGDDTPVADDTTVPTSVGGTDSTPTSHVTTSATTPAVTYTEENSDVLSLTSTGNDHQWALVRTPAGGCAEDGPCAMVFARDAGGSWAPSSVLPAPAYSGTGDPAAVGELRFVAGADTRYDGWAFGPGLLSTHDGGQSWEVVHSRELGSSVDENAITSVSDVEARGSTAYALMLRGESDMELISSPTGADDWHPVEASPNTLGMASDLNVSEGVVAFVGVTGGNIATVLSNETDSAGATMGHWDETQPCGSGGVEHLSSSANVLWALCSDGSVATAAVEGDPAPSWTTVAGAGTFDHTGHSLIAARDASSALVAQDSGVSVVSSAGGVALQTHADFHSASLFGFTNDRLGFVVVDGRLLRTEDGGDTWNEEQVVPPSG